MKESTGRSKSDMAVQSAGEHHSGIGCKCKKATCLVKFCECVQARTSCGSMCKCFNCGYGYRPNVVILPKVAPTNDREQLPDKSADSANSSRSRRPSFRIRRLSKKSFTYHSASKINLNSDDGNPSSKVEAKSPSLKMLGVEDKAQRSSQDQQEVEDKLLARRDEHVSTSTSAISTQIEPTDSKDAHETRMRLEKERAKHQEELLETEKEDVLSKVNKLEADMGTTIEEYDVKIDNLNTIFSKQIEGVNREKDEIGDKLTTIQDEHVWISSQLLSLQNEMLASKDSHEIQMRLEKQKSKQAIDVLEADKAGAIARASKFEADIDATIKDYEAMIGDLTLSYSNEIEGVKTEKARAEKKLSALQDEHARTIQDLTTAQKELKAFKSTHEIRVKMLESQIEQSTNHMQMKIKLLEKELESMKAYRKYSNPMFNQYIPPPKTSSSVTIQGTSDDISADSDAVEEQASHVAQTPSQMKIISGTGFVDMDVFDGSSLSSACSSTSYDA